jgi:hypothetical protein
MRSSGVVFLLLFALSSSLLGSEEPRGRFFKLDVFDVRQALAGETFPLGQVTPGETVRIQLYVSNLSKEPLVIRSIEGITGGFELESTPVKIEPGEQGTVFARAVVPTEAKELEAPIRLIAELTTNCRLACSFPFEPKGVVVFRTKSFVFAMNDTQANSETMEFPIPLIVSKDIDLKSLTFRTDDSLSLVTLTPKVIDGTTCLNVRFFPRVMETATCAGSITLRNTVTKNESVLRLRLEKKGDIRIAPSPIVFRRELSTGEYVGEGVISCIAPGLKIDDIDFHCEISNADTIEWRVGKMGERLGRIYFRIKPSPEKVEGNPEILVQAFDALKTRDVYLDVLFGTRLPGGTMMFWIRFSVVCGLAFLGSKVHGEDCYVNVVRDCGDPPYTNECSLPCIALGAYCGDYVTTDDSTYRWVAKAGIGQTGKDQIDYLSTDPVWCGIMRECRCDLPDLMTLTCEKTINRNVRFIWTDEAQVTGDECVGNLIPDGDPQTGGGSSGTGSGGGVGTGG